MDTFTLLIWLLVGAIAIALCVAALGALIGLAVETYAGTRLWLQVRRRRREIARRHR